MERPVSIPSLEGRRVRVRDLRVEDLPDYERWLLPGQRWQELDAPWERKADRAEVKRIILRLRAAIPAGALRDPRVRMTIAARDSDAFLGTVSWYWESEATRWASVGIGIYDPYTWGRGYGYEALGLWCDYLLDSFPGWARIGCTTWSGNLGMMRLAEKVGFRLESRVRKARRLDRGDFDALGYGALREEWRARYPAGFAASLDEGG